MQYIYIDYHSIKGYYGITKGGLNPVLIYNILWLFSFQFPQSHRLDINNNKNVAPSSPSFPSATLKLTINGQFGKNILYQW